MPMKLILSRKGFDSSAGGKPSPIFPDGTMISLPIPDKASPTAYQDIAGNQHASVGEMVEHLAKRPPTHRVTWTRICRLMPCQGCGAGVRSSARRVWRKSTLRITRSVPVTFSSSLGASGELNEVRLSGSTFVHAARSM